MILSFHPIFEGNRNILCAGRSPSDQDLEAIKGAKAVILPQGCTAALYKMARKHCPRVFPNYDARYQYPGKIGQIQLFQKTKASHPATITYNYLKELSSHPPSALPPKLPFVFKFDWGGEGSNVYFIETKDQWQNTIEMTAAYEQTGQNGFLIQEYIPTQQKSLRVVVIGEKIISYWRKQAKPDAFATSISQGAKIDQDTDPERQAEARSATRVFCQKTGINLAGIDILFSTQKNSRHPLFLEINYYFGRQGLGGSGKYYQLLDNEIRNWIKCQGLTLKN
jgi:ribosomal protein S6--L-glutamate ligase